MNSDSENGRGDESKAACLRYAVGGFVTGLATLRLVENGRLKRVVRSNLAERKRKDTRLAT